MKKKVEKIKSYNELKDFLAFCNAFPEQRFWQALRNWANVDRIIIEKDNVQVDTFYK